MGDKQDLVQSFHQLTSNQRDQVRDEDISGSVRKQHVKLKIEHGKCLFIFESGLHLREQLVQLLDLFRGSMKSGICGRYALQRHAHFKQILEVVPPSNQWRFYNLPQKPIAISRDRRPFSNACSEPTKSRQAAKS